MEVIDMVNKLCIKCGMKLTKLNWELYCVNCGKLPENQHQPKSDDKMPSYVK